MENPSTLWNLALFAAALVALVIIGTLIARSRRARAAARGPVHVAESAPAENAEEELDSSHIGFAPLVNSPAHPAPGPGAGPSGEDAGGARG